MRHHQKYFSVESAPDMLAPNFVAVMNTIGDPEGLVKHGNERVLRARFNDARFFWNVDQQKKLVDRVEDLRKVTFQAKLGSYFEKTKRVVELVKELGGNAHAQRAALLAKCDLTTEMVKEFTDLQGVVGGLYAKAKANPKPSRERSTNTTSPLSMEDSIPETPEGQIVSLADKLDTLRECFRIGMVPSGSKDPFALRRAAQGVVKILVEAQAAILRSTSWRSGRACANSSSIGSGIISASPRIQVRRSQRGACCRASATLDCRCRGALDRLCRGATHPRFRATRRELQTYSATS